MLKKISVTSIVLFFLLSIFHVASAASLSDISGHKNETAIQYLYENNVISGYPDGSFKPNTTVNRAELLKILVGGKNIQTSITEYNNCFPDVKNEWFAPYVCYAKSQNWVEGYPDGTFKPSQPVNKVEAIKMLIESQDYNLITTNDPPYSDVPNDAWFTNYINTAKAKGLLEETGYRFGSAENMTRAGISENIYRSMIINENKLQYFGEYVEINELEEMNPSRTFKMLVFMDDNSYTVSDSEIRDYFLKASKLLYDRTTVSIEIIDGGIWHVNVNQSTDVDSITYQTFSNNKNLVKQVNGFVFFTKANDCARTNGGCAWSVAPNFNLIGINDYCNTFSDLDKKTNQLYGSTIDWGHKYGACGYDENDKHISNTSLADGSCRNTPNVNCVVRNGYYMCENLINEYYATNLHLMTTSIIIHEIMHSYGENGVMDHFGTEVCLQYPKHEKNFDCPTSSLNESVCYFQMCPYTYENFKNSENLCN
jgi:hypothetical protein